MLHKFPVGVFVVMLTLLIAGAVHAQIESEVLRVYDDWGGDFTLTDHNGFSLSLSDFSGKVVLLNFGYTHCPDICPTTMFTFKRVVKALGDDAEKLQVLFITLDPERDHLNRLRAYAEYFDSGFISLTGSVEDISSVADRYGIVFEKENFDAEGNYSIAHNAVIYLIDQLGRIRVFYRINASAEGLAAGVRQLLNKN